MTTTQGKFFKGFHMKLLVKISILLACMFAVDSTAFAQKMSRTEQARQQHVQKRTHNARRQNIRTQKRTHNARRQYIRNNQFNSNISYQRDCYGRWTKVYTPSCPPPVYYTPPCPPPVYSPRLCRPRGSVMFHNRRVSIGIGF